MSKKFKKENKAEYDKKYYELNRDKILKRQKEYRENNKDKIVNSKKEYRKNNRNKISEYSFNYRKENIIELCQYDKNYRENNKDKINLQSKKRYKENNSSKQKKKDSVKRYAEKNKKKISLRKKKYFQDNKSTIVRKHSERQKQRKQDNPSLKLRYNISRLINFMLKSQGLSKAGQSISMFLEWKTPELIVYIEQQFEPWMNWNNYGKYNSKTWNDNEPSTWTWQLDHIIPQSDLLYDSMDHPNFKKCWALENLRPLNAKQNILDGVKKIRHKGLK